MRIRGVHRRLLSLGLLVLFLTACGKEQAEQKDSLPPARQISEKSDYSDEITVWTDSLLNTMDTVELVGQLVMPSSFGQADEYTGNRLVRLVRERKIGGVLWLKGDTLSVKILCDTLQKASQIPMFMAIDAEWGLAMRLEGAREYPKNYRLGSVADDTIYDYGREIGKDSREIGLNVVFAPVMDVSGGKGTPMHSRSYGEEAGRVSDKGKAFARGLKDGGVMPVAKHFPGIGRATEDSHKSLPIVDEDRSIVYARDISPFKEYIREGIGGIMTGHVAVKALDSVVRPATLSPVILTDLLRNELGFKGIIFSDAMNMKGITRGEKSPYVEALKAGVDVLVVPPDTEDAIEEIMRALRAGELSQDEVRAKVRNILLYKFSFRQSADYRNR